MPKETNDKLLFTCDRSRDRSRQPPGRPSISRHWSAEEPSNFRSLLAGYSLLQMAADYWYYLAYAISMLTATTVADY